MKNKIKIPERLVRVMDGTPEIDVSKRSIKACVATQMLARDGGIVLLNGVDLRAFKLNPVVQALHGMSDDIRSPVIGRAADVTVHGININATTLFADTELGREYAYLYGVNEKKEVFMRAWSFGWTTLDMDFVSLDEARTMLGAAWDEATVPQVCRRYGEVWVARKSEMLEYSAVPVGADRAALSRAFAQNIRTAGTLVADIDLKEAQAAIDELRKNNRDLAARCDRFDEDIKALRSEGSAAAARGDSAGLVEAIRAMCATAK